VLLLVLGILLAASGVVAAGFGVPLNELALGSVLISGGVTALTGGLILIGLSAVVGELARLTDGLQKTGSPVAQFDPEGDQSIAASVLAPSMPPAVSASAPRQPAPGNPRPVRARAEFPAREVRPPAYPPSPSSVEVSASAIERLRSTIPRSEQGRIEPTVPGYGEDAPLSPNGGNASSPGTGPPRPEPARPDAGGGAEDRGASAAEPPRGPRLEFLFRSKSRPSQQENSEADWQEDRESRPSRSSAAVAEPVAAPHLPERPLDAGGPGGSQARSNPPPAQSPSSPAVLKSGVVDGMAYTLFTDGSIEAQLPQGIVRFGSVAELRAHIESHS
jgi:hypothetical protein